MFKIRYVIFVLLALAACQSDQRSEALLFIHDGVQYEVPTVYQVDTSNLGNPTVQEEISLEPTLVVGADESELFMHAGIVRTTDDGSIFVLDYGDLDVKVFDQQGNLKRTVGEGAGEGPGEFRQMGRFDVHPESGELYITDRGRRLVAAFDDEGDFRWHSAAYAFTIPSEVVATDDQVVAFQPRHGQPYVFTRYSQEGDSLGMAGRLLHEEMNELPFRGSRAFHYSGHLLADGEGGYILAPNRLPHVLRFDQNHDLMYARVLRTEASPPVVEVEETEVGGRTTTFVGFEDNTPVTTYTLHRVGPYIVTMTGKEGDTYVFDAYFLADGLYAFSFEADLPTADMQSIYMDDDRLYFVEWNRVSVYSHDLMQVADR